MGAVRPCRVVARASVVWCCHIARLSGIHCSTAACERHCSTAASGRAWSGRMGSRGFRGLAGAARHGGAGRYSFNIAQQRGVSLLLETVPQQLGLAAAEGCSAGMSSPPGVAATVLDGCRMFCGQVIPSPGSFVALCGFAVRCGCSMPPPPPHAWHSTHASCCLAQCPVLASALVSGACSISFAVLVSCLFPNCLSNCRMSLQGLRTLKMLSSAIVAAAGIYLPARSHIFKSRVDPSDKSSPWLLHPFIEASKACLSYFILLFLKIKVHTWRAESSTTKVHAPMFLVVS